MVTQRRFSPTSLHWVTWFRVIDQGPNFFQVRGKISGQSSDTLEECALPVRDAPGKLAVTETELRLLEDRIVAFFDEVTRRVKGA